MGQQAFQDNSELIEVSREREADSLHRSGGL